MRVHNKIKSRRLRKIALWASAGFLTFVLAHFFVMRRADRMAWPAGAPGVSLAIVAPAVTNRLAAPADVGEVMVGFSEADSALIDEYRLFQKTGLADGRVFPLLDARLVDPGARFEAILRFWKHFDGFDAKHGSMPVNTFIGIHAEHAVLACYAAHAEHVVEGLPAERAEARLAVLSNAIKLSNGGGLIGRYAALNTVMVVVRESIMDPIVFADVAAVTSYVSRVRALELNIGDLGEALRTDLISLHEAIALIYGETGMPAAPATVARSRRMSRVGEFSVRMLGGSFDDTRDNIDGLFSRLIRNASEPYSEEGLAKGLPAWCRHEARPPSTRDPVGAAVAGAYMKHAVFASIVQPSLELELRAMRIAVALAYLKRLEKAYPVALGALVTAGLLEERDLVDPFAGDGASQLSYARDGDGWRFYSVGRDQVDGGGEIDAYRTVDPKKQKDSDFVFTSHERKFRLDAHRATQSEKNTTAEATQVMEEE